MAWTSILRSCWQRRFCFLVMDELSERQLTDGSENVILTNAAVWSHDSRWIYYDVRSDPSGSVFDGDRIERIEVRTREREAVYRSQHGAKVGVVTANPVREQIVFIHGPEHPSEDWQYAAFHRQGVLFCPATHQVRNLDARDLVAPFTPGALRGGSHVHVFSGDGQWVSFTYEDHVLAVSANARANHRNVGVSVPVQAVVVPKTHPRNQDGDYFSVLVTQTTDDPQPDSDQINRAYSDAWVGRDGYRRRDNTWQKRAIAFIGDCLDQDGCKVSELFIVDIPDAVTAADQSPLCGTATARPAPPKGTVQRRLTFTSKRRYPGLGDVRHWPRSNPDGTLIAFLLKDDAGRNQLWTIDPIGESLRQLTVGDEAVESAFTFRADGKMIACVIGGRVCEVDVDSGIVTTLTPVSSGPHASKPDAQAVVYSPDGRSIAFQRRVASPHSQTVAPSMRNAIFVVASRLSH